MKLERFSKGDNVLLLGEGNLSFARSLFSHNLPIKITATCHNDKPNCKYQQENIEFLLANNIPVFLDVDATTLHENVKFKSKTFSKIIFNFPHVGGKMKIHLNRKLIRKVCESSSHILKNNGELFITLCGGQGGTPADNPQRKWDDSWQIVEMAAHGNFCLEAVEPFDFKNFKSYSCTGYRSQDSCFNLKGALVHIFRKRLFPSRILDEELLLKRLSHVPISKNSNILVPYYYSYLYSRNLLSNHNSVVSFFQKLVKEAFLVPEKWLYINDENVPLYVKSNLGVKCVVNGNGEYRLRSSAIQIIDHVLKTNNFFVNDRNIFHTGIYFHPVSGPSFTDSPISFQFLLLGTDISQSFSNFMKELISSFKSRNLKINSNTMNLFYDESKADMINFHKLLLYNVDFKNFSYKTVKEWNCVLFNGINENNIIARELIFEHEKNTLEAFIIYIEEITKACFDVNRWQEIWCGDNFVSFNSVPVLIQCSIYPLLYKFDITLKYNTENKIFENDVYEVLRLSAVDIIHDVEMINEYNSNADWSSKCFRITYKSLNEPFHRNKVLDIHTKLIGKMLTLALPVSIK